MARFRETRDEGAFTALYELARAPLLGWIVQFLGARRHRMDPLEVLQDTFVNVYRYAASFDETGGRAFQGWARTIAANVVRRRLTRVRPMSLQALPNGAQEPADTRSGPARTALLDEQRRAVSQAWALLLLHYATAYAKLSERDQRALHLVEVEGLSYVEAGTVLGVGRSNMKMIIFRGRKRIRAHVLRAMMLEGGQPLRRAV